MSKGRSTLDGLLRTPLGAYEAPRSPEARILESAIVPLPSQSDGVRGVLERADRTVALPTTATVLVYAMVRRWRGVDVYADLAGATLNNAATIVSFAVFAVSRGKRTLVGTGRMRGGAATARVCSVRSAIAELFEVELGFEGLPLTSNEAVAMTILGSDEALLDPDECDGVISMSGTGLMVSGASLVSTNDPFPFQLMGVNGVSAVAGRFLHVHDTNNPLAFPGRAPIFAFGPVDVGGGFVDSHKLLGIRRAFLAGVGIGICMSSTAAVTTLAAVGDWALNGWVR